MAISEMQWASANQLVYSPLTSCLTVNCVMESGYLLGAHLVADRRANTPTVLQAMDNARRLSPEISAIYLVGVTGVWTNLPTQGMGWVYEQIVQHLKDDHIAGRVISTSGKSERVQVDIVSATQIRIQVTYPPSADETLAAGSHMLPRTVESAGLL